MKKLIILITTLLITCSIQAQINWTKAEIIEELGYDYETGINNDGYPYIFYKKDTYSKNSGSYIMYKAFYFDSNNICFSWMIVEPITEINFNINYYNSQYVPTDVENEWIDYKTGYYYYVYKNENNLSVIEVYKEKIE